MNIRLFFLIIYLFLFSYQIYSKDKSDNLKPKWLTQELPKSKSGTYFFVKAHGVGASINEAKQIAFIGMSQKLEAERGITIDTNIEISEIITQNSTRTKSEYSQEVTLDVKEKNRTIKIKCREIDEYWVKKDGLYHIDVLYTITNNNTSSSYDDDILITNRYGNIGFLSIIPGAGQLYKGNNIKGSSVIAGEVIAISGIILCENTRASYIKKMKEQPKYKSEYNSRADSWETGRNICIGAAATLYLYNIIDAFVADGAKRVLVKRKNNTKISFIPYSNFKQTGISIMLNF